MKKAMWRERIPGSIDPEFLKFASQEDLSLDENLIIYDIIQNEVHALMLYKIGVLDFESLKKILMALEDAKKLHSEGKFKLDLQLEDVHMNIENFVTEKASDAGKMLHIGRSRNDQVLTDIRMYMREKILGILEELCNVISELLKLADENADVIMPAYTHLQHAQLMLFSYWCLANVDALLRDANRLLETLKRVNVCPLGAGAVAGVPLPIDREFTAKMLGFEGIQENALDAISSRGEMELETLAQLNILALHIARIAEDLILWTTREFNFVKLGDAYCTGSSALPQKRNPDSLELIRARSMRIPALLLHTLLVLKGLPSGYMRDMQETKFSIISAMETTSEILKILAKVLSSIKLNKDVLEKTCQDTPCTLPDLAIFLSLEKKIPFRTAYNIVAALAKHIAETGTKPSQLSAKMVAEICTRFTNPPNISDEEIKNALDPQTSIQRRCHIGGTSSDEILRMLSDRRKALTALKNKISEFREKLNKTLEKVSTLVNSIISSEKTWRWNK